MNATDSLRYRAAAARRAIYHAAAARNAALKAQAELTEGNACSVATLNQLNRAITSLENAIRLAEQAFRRWHRKADRIASSATSASGASTAPTAGCPGASSSPATTPDRSAPAAGRAER